ncbi:uncharacterized protein A4U43_C01F30850 [Asparagus officinalis]|uniref:Ubiquitin-like protease family profile domain-containing protein n=1 Tax=Asparagus officinalis TaxID=4686 RepID=A0A5P1FTP3_ASPOF|nr:uncharacterized protein A4U43_C01F30850 [Asparagus officinalis]
MVRILDAQRKWVRQEDMGYVVLHCMRIRENEVSYRDEWKIENVDGYSTETRHVPQQDESLDCGIFMMGYIYSIINDTLPFIHQNNCELLRAKIAIVFISKESDLLEYAFTQEVDSEYICLGCPEC